MEKQYTNGCEQVQMGAHGCVWVRCDRGGMGSTKTRQEGVTYDLTGQDLGPMAGEISPDIMFWGFCQKNDLDGCRWVQSGSDGHKWMY